MDNARLVHILSDIPETSLHIHHIIRQHLRPDGTVDPDQIRTHPEAEIRFAIAEAENYRLQTHRFNERLTRLATQPAR